MVGYLSRNRSHISGRRTVVPMTRSAIAAAAALLATVVAGCGSSGQSATPTASVESASESGAVASIEACPEGPPARGLLKGDLNSGDGAFGTIRNNTGSTVWLWSVKRDVTTPCRLDTGKGASYASRTVGDVYPTSRAAWVPQGSSPGMFYILVSSSPDVNSPGVALGVLDPYIGTPSAASVYRTPAGATCPTATGELSTGGLSEDREYRLQGPAPGNVLVKRFRDNKSTAREWTGQSNSDDWAIIDFYVDQIGRC